MFPRKATFIAAGAAAVAGGTYGIVNRYWERLERC